MTINKLTATFGKLDQETIEFHEGLNVISAPNESGKSTWCAFITAMLYGVNTSERGHGDRIPGKVRYQPWNGKAMCGTMELTSHKKNITLMRSTPVSSAPMKDFSAFYTETGAKVSELNASDAGQTLTGLSAGLFLRSACIAQGDTVLSCDAETEKQIMAFLSSGEGGVSFKEADAKLASWHKKRIQGNTCLVAKNNDEAERLSVGLSDIHALEATLKTDREVFHKKKEHLAQLKKEAFRLEKQARQELQKRISDAYADAIKEKNNCTLASRKADEIATAMKKRRSVIAAVTISAAILLMAFYTFVFRSRVLPVLSGILILTCLYALIRKSAFSGKLKAAEQTERCEEKRAGEAYHAAREKIQFLEAALMRGKMPRKYSAEMNRLKDEAFGVKEELKTLSREITVLNAKQNMAGDASFMESRLEQLKQEADELEEESRAIDFARNVLAAADHEIQNSISPLLSQKTTEYMTFLTGGKYDRVLLDRDLSAMAAEKGESVPHKSGFLSAGTRDLLYIAVRLAVCSLSLEKDDACPLIIDDAFVNLDAARYQRTMDLLEELSHERQVILFTCRE